MCFCGLFYWFDWFFIKIACPLSFSDAYRSFLGLLKGVQECRISDAGFQALFCLSVSGIFQGHGFCLNLHSRCSTDRKLISKCLVNSLFPAFQGRRNVSVSGSSKNEPNTLFFYVAGRYCSVTVQTLDVIFLLS